MPASSVLYQRAILGVVFLAVLILIWFGAQQHFEKPVDFDIPLLQPNTDTHCTSTAKTIAADAENTLSVKNSSLHYLIPANQAKASLCAVVASSLVNRYPIPRVLGYKGEGQFDAHKAHIAKLRSIQRYLDATIDAPEDDLVIIVDGFDVLPNIPADAMLERYFEGTAKADELLADQHGISVEEAHARGLRQTIMFGTDKGCYMRNEDPECWLLPSSTLPRYIFGPKTNNGDVAYSDSKYLNSGTIIGPLGDLRRLTDATLLHIYETWKEDEKYKNSDQFYIAQMYARQEYQRTLNLNGGVFPNAGSRNVPAAKTSEYDVTEFHIFVDFDSSFTQTQCHNDRFMRQLQYKNYDHTATIEEDALEEGKSFRPYNIRMPSALRQAFIRLYESVLVDGGKPSVSAQEWVRDLNLGTNIATQKIWGFYHNTCSKRKFVDKYRDSWFFPLIKPLLRAAAVANREGEPLHPDVVDGRVWVATQRYPSESELYDEFGGVFTDYEAEPFIPLQQLCAKHVGEILE